MHVNTCSTRVYRVMFANTPLHFERDRAEGGDRMAEELELGDVLLLGILVIG